MMVARKTVTRTPIGAVRHADKRVNIPTEELRDFVADDEDTPSTLLYPRDPSLDPQLVWKGKDEQDRADLAVPVVPIYIQEKIEPRVLIEAMRSEATGGAPRQASLFADFDGIGFEEMVEFYQHEQNWANRMILGDSLLAMTSLAEKEGLKGKVQMIYIDPPYGIKFGSNWQVSTRKRDVKDGRADDLTRQPEQVKAFRDTWELGIHSYLSYLRDRLVAAREMLTESGSVFVQIGDENVHLVRCLIDEVFGADNAVNTIVFKKTSSEGSEGLSNVADYLLWYAKDKRSVKKRDLLVQKVPGGDGARQYVLKLSPNGDVARMTKQELADPSLLPAGWRVCRNGFPITSQNFSATRTKVFWFDGEPYLPGADRHWSLDPENELPMLVNMGRIYSTGKSLNAIVCLDEMPTTESGNVWTDTGTGSFTNKQIYVVQTSEKVVQRCMLMCTHPGDIVLDPTCGSGTTAYVAEQWGRRWITIDTSRVALALARVRLMAAKYPYYILRDSAEGIVREAELTGQPVIQVKTEGDIKKGFMNKRARHASLSDIARGVPGNGRELLDQPYEDTKRVRVSGPFTVESLSPHRVLTADEERPASEREAESVPAAGQFETMVIDNLRKAGVQNTKRGERLVFDRLEPYAGGWLQAAGEYTMHAQAVEGEDDEHGATAALMPQSRRVAISIGPEHGTVGPDQVKEAAKEAMRGAGFDMLVICGFAFDAHAGETAQEFSPEPLKQRQGFVAEETRQYGKLPVLLARMNPDLSMGDELLKKTGSGNLFMVFGEPDLEISQQGEDRVAVEIRGVDVYDPTTGEIRSNSTDDIACWFIDTDYNEEAFFVRHAYFTGADQPYDKLKRALRAEVDEDAWSALYSTVSRPFERPSSGKIAVKVINHYGDEVLKVLAV